MREKPSETLRENWSEEVTERPSGYDPLDGAKPLVEDRLGERARVFGAERAILAGIDAGASANVPIEESMEELASLADTAGITVLAWSVQKRQRPVPATYLGKGKVDELGISAAELEADVIIFNGDLSPAQGRNLESRLNRKIIDRTQLIMDIFAQRAATKESKIQVELAQLRYLLPRLRGWGEALTRTGGGIGTRGPGETQLEIDRFKITRRIHLLEKRLRKAQAERSVRRGKRERSGLPQVTLVGYTNSGKSTLLNRLCQSESMVEDKLFATLDTMVRRGEAGPGRVALFVDTVGFIRDLPHDLVPAFATTLEAARHADLILHVIDRTHASWERDEEVVLRILEEEVFEKGDRPPPILAIFNKVDLLEPEPICERGVALSAKEGLHIDHLLGMIAEHVFPEERAVDLLVPFSALNALHEWTSPDRREGEVHTGKGLRVRVRVTSRELSALHAAGAQVAGADEEMTSG